MGRPIRLGRFQADNGPGRWLAFVSAEDQSPARVLSGGFASEIRPIFASRSKGAAPRARLEGHFFCQARRKCCRRAARNDLLRADNSSSGQTAANLRQTHSRLASPDLGRPPESSRRRPKLAAGRVAVRKSVWSRGRRLAWRVPGRRRLEPRRDRHLLLLNVGHASGHL